MKKLYYSKSKLYDNYNDALECIYSICHFCIGVGFITSEQLEKRDYILNTAISFLNAKQYFHIDNLNEIQ